MNKSVFVLFLFFCVLCNFGVLAQRKIDIKLLEESYSETDSLRPHEGGTLQMRSYENRFAGFNLGLSQYHVPEIKLGLALGRGFLNEDGSMHGVLSYHLFPSAKGHGISYTGKLISDGKIRMGGAFGYGFYWSRKETAFLWTMEMILGFKNFWFLLNFNAEQFNNWFANGDYYFLGFKKEWGVSLNYILPLYNQQTNKIHYRTKYWKEIKNGPWIKIKKAKKASQKTG